MACRADAVAVPGDAKEQHQRTPRTASSPISVGAVVARRIPDPIAFHAPASAAAMLVSAAPGGYRGTPKPRRDAMDAAKRGRRGLLPTAPSLILCHKQRNALKMWGRMASCAAVANRRWSVSTDRWPIDNRPQVSNLPHRASGTFMTQ